MAAHAWESDGLRIDVAYDFIDPPLSVQRISEQLMAILPEKFSPLNRHSKGNQGYLFALPDAAGRLILDALGQSDLPGVSKKATAARPITPRLNDSVAETWLPRRHAPGSHAVSETPPGLSRRSAAAKRIGDQAERAVIE